MKHLSLFTILILLCTSSHAQWSTICGSGDGMVVSLANNNDTIYATGFFKEICSNSTNYVAKWDGQQWLGLDTGLSDAGHRVKWLNNELYVAQYMQRQDSNWVLKWDGTYFEKIGAGIYLTNVNAGTSKVPNLYDVAIFNGHLVASGEFDVVGNQQISGIMQWNGNSWDSLSSGLAGSIDGSGIMYPHQLLVFNNNLYVVGNFKYAGRTAVNGVARWDGTQWYPMGAGFNAEVYGIGVFNNEIYVGGEFTLSGSTQLQGIAKWNGNQWVNPGFGVYYSSPLLHAYVHTVEQVGTHIIFEGGFDKSISNGDTSVSHGIIAYDGNTVDTLDGGVLNGEFEGLSSLGTDLLIGGAKFGLGTDTSHIARYHFHNAGVKTISENALIIYPNPATTYINLPVDLVPASYSIFNTIGQVIGIGSLDAYKAVIPIKELTSGIYYLQLKMTDGTLQHTRFIKQ